MVRSTLPQLASILQGSGKPALPRQARQGPQQASDPVVMREQLQADLLALQVRLSTELQTL